MLACRRVIGDAPIKTQPQPDCDSGAPDGDRPLKWMFDAIPRRYDLLNRLLTGRFDERWRALAARRVVEGRPARVLDLCCGTGDLALRIARLVGASAEVVGMDFAPGMLVEARDKAARAQDVQPVTFVEGDATAMTFDDESFDAVGIAFAFRNLTWKNPMRRSALAEVLRVLRGGGRFVIVETSQPSNRILRACFHAYFSACVAPVGRLISGNKAAYRYLATSVRDFCNAEEVSAMLIEAGLDKVDATPLMGGMAAIHVAIKPR